MPTAPTPAAVRLIAAFVALGALALLALGATTLALYLRQESLVFVGASNTRPMPPHDPLTGVLPRADGRPRAWVAEPPPGRPVRATLVMFHGNAAYAQHRFPMRGVFVDRGLRVVFAEYPGYGERRDEAATFASVSRDARDLVRETARTWPHEPVWLLGESLGAAVAARAAAGEPRVARVILAVPWHRLDTLAQSIYPLLPVAPLVRDRLDSCDALRPVAARVHVVFAEADQVIPAAQARSLARCLDLPDHRVESLPATGHDGWFDALDRRPGAWERLLDGPGVTR